MRLFIAINFTEEFKDKILTVQRELKLISVSGLFTPPENMHLTLAFIGETDAAGRDIAIRVLRGLKAAAFTLILSRAGNFKGKAKEGKLYWLGTDNSPSLSDIHRYIADALSDSGILLEDREFEPHITLGRRVILKPGSVFKPQFEPISCRVKSIELMLSEYAEKGMRYSPLYSATLSEKIRS